MNLEYLLKSYMLKNLPYLYGMPYSSLCHFLFMSRRHMALLASLLVVNIKSNVELGYSIGSSIWACTGQQLTTSPKPFARYTDYPVPHFPLETLPSGTIKIPTFYLFLLKLKELIHIFKVVSCPEKILRCELWKKNEHWTRIQLI